jgi:phosphate acyltransferase
VTRIALDAMGGDFAPSAPVSGALRALRELDEQHVVQLVGRADDLERELAAHGDIAARQRHRIGIVDAPDVVTMSDRPTAVLRGKPNNSMAVGLRLHADGRSDAFVSAGNTGAQMAASAMLLKLHPGLTRPAIATVFPTAGRSLVFLDAGANVDCSARELVQFAWLGATYAETVLRRDNPRIGLLSIGEESEKGNAVVKEANALFRAAGFNFVGNVEGRDIPRGEGAAGRIDVVVCDGFVGNAILKFYEAVMPMLLAILRRHAGVNESHVSEALAEFDKSRYGAAPLLGVRGVSMICHGNSDPNAVAVAIKDAVQAAESGMNEMMGSRLAAVAGEAQRTPNHSAA